MSKSRRITLLRSVILDDLLSPGCPASGNEIKMTEKEKIMKFVTLGIVKNGFYYIEEGEDETYTFYCIDEIPPIPLYEFSLRKFLYDHETEGYSCTGSWNEVLCELRLILEANDEVIELDL